MPQPDEFYESKSADFRSYINGLSPMDRSYAIDLIQNALAIKNRRNVELWFATAGTTRNFLNRAISAEDQKIRVKLIDTLRQIVPAPGPQKKRDVIDGAKKAGQKLREYLLDPYTRRAMTKIDIFNGGVSFEYDTYTEQTETAIDDSDTLEFGDVITND